MNPDHVTSKWMITGPSGSGKSTLLRRAMHSWRARVVWVFDKDGNLARADGARACTRRGQFATAGRIIYYDPSEEFPGKPREAFDWFCRFAITAAKGFHGVKLLVVDELQNFVRVGGKPPGAEFLEIIHDGRKPELDFLAVSQAPNLVHYEVRPQITRTITFRHEDELVLEWLRGQGFNPEEVKKLPQFAWIAKCHKTGNRFKS